MTRAATLSEDGLYRYDLTRWLHPPMGSTLRACLFLMLNPSTADATTDDHTIRCCRRFAAREGCAELHVLNLYAYRTPSPAALVAAHRSGLDIIGPDTDEHLRRLLARMAPPRARVWPLVVAAWGSRPAGLPADVHDARIRQVVAEVAQPLHALGTTADGSPRHPSRLPVDAPLVRWPT